MPYEKGTAKTAAIPVQKLTAWETFLRTHGYPLEENPKPMEVLEGLWKLLNLWASQPRTLETVTHPATGPQQISAPDPVMAHVENRHGPVQWMGFYESDSDEAIRKAIITKWSEANQQDAKVLDAMIRQGKVQLYDAASRMVDHLKGKLAHTSIATYRSGLERFYRFAKYEGYTKEEFKRYVRKAIAIVDTQKKSLTRENIHEIIKAADPSIQGYLLLLSVTGWRVGEPLELKVRDFKFGYETPAGPVPIVTLPALNDEGELTNKTGRSTESFLTEEAVAYFKDQFKDKNPDSQAFQFKKDEPYSWIMKAIRKSGLAERAGRLNRNMVHPHSFRVFLEEHMTNLEFPQQHIDLQSGHKPKHIQGQSYTTLVKRWEMWKAKGMDKLRFLEESIPLPELKADKLLRKPEPPQDPMIERQRLENEKLRLEVEQLKAHQEPHAVPMKPAPAPDSPPTPSKGPSIMAASEKSSPGEKLSPSQDPNAPVHRDGSWHCPRCDAYPTQTRESMLAHIRFRHEPKNSLEGWV